MIKSSLRFWLFSSRSLAGLSQQQSVLSRMLQFLKKRYQVLKMKYRTLKLFRRRRNARKRIQTTEKLIQVLVIFLMLALVFLVSCENIKHKIGISTKPLQSGEQLKNSTKLNYTIVFGKVRPQEDD